MSVSASAAPPLEFVITSPGRAATVAGTLGVRTVPDLRTRLQALLDSGDGDLVLNLGRADVADATGLGVLVGLHQRATRRGRRLVIGDASERLERLLRVTRLHLVIARTEAVAARLADLGEVPGHAGPLRTLGHGTLPIR